MNLIRTFCHVYLIGMRTCNNMFAASCYKSLMVMPCIRRCFYFVLKYSTKGGTKTNSIKLCPAYELKVMYCINDRCKLCAFYIVNSPMQSSSNTPTVGNWRIPVTRCLVRILSKQVHILEILLPLHKLLAVSKNYAVHKLF